MAVATTHEGGSKSRNYLDKVNRLKYGVCWGLNACCVCLWENERGGGGTGGS